MALNKVYSLKKGKKKKEKKRKKRIISCQEGRICKSLLRFPEIRLTMPLQFVILL